MFARPVLPRQDDERRIRFRRYRRHRSGRTPSAGREAEEGRDEARLSSGIARRRRAMLCRGGNPRPLPRVSSSALTPAF